MSRILAIDPGSEQSAYVFLDGGAIRHPGNFGKVPNDQLLASLKAWHGLADHVVIEWLSSYGRPVGAEVFETAYCVGRFKEASGVSVWRLTRPNIVRHLIGGPRRKDDPTADAMVWQALVDRFGGIGGKEAAVGRKASPGPLYGIHADVRAALAVAVTFADDPKLAVR